VIPSGTDPAEQSVRREKVPVETVLARMTAKKSWIATALRASDGIYLGKVIARDARTK